ncbi:hypothetical protein ZIOFF_042665 [Zingiber officinale]|uniref:Uncharacterized protein n=2 Tax=Zingiber officinale TaxID=94328 RepID=A0A8J5G9P0_ZINOF|nr:hypothetical protein ZIOFF_042665 [Zingiber officinale]
MNMEEEVKGDAVAGVARRKRAVVANPPNGGITRGRGEERESSEIIMRGQEEEAPTTKKFGNVSDNDRSEIYSQAGAAAAVTAGELTPPTQRRFASPGFVANGGLALGLQSNVDVQNNGMMAGVASGSVGSRENAEYSSNRNREDDDGSRSGSENLDAISGEDADPGINSSNRRRRKRYHRHTPQQIQELEAMFKDCPHPDDKQRQDLSRRLRLEPRQIKFWFQNRRTQMKTQIERHENSILRQENDKLRAENVHYRDMMINPRCPDCGMPATLGEISPEEQQLRIENARLKEELDRVCTLAGRFIGKSFSSLSVPAATPMSSIFELGASVAAGNYAAGGLSLVPPSVGALHPDYNAVVNPIIPPPPGMQGGERGLLVELALAAMEELVAIAQLEEPLWVRGFDGAAETLNYEQYCKYRRITGLSPVGYTPEATRESGMVLISAIALVDTMMDANKWIEMFPCIVTAATVDEVITPGVAGTRDGALQIMQAELQVLSPLVAVRELRFLRFCKQHGEGTWTIVDVSVDSIRNGCGLIPASCRRLPSGCLVQDMANGYCKVTWVEHTEYDEEQVSQMYKHHLRSGTAFGAGRWVAALRRRCEVVDLLTSSIARRDLDTGMMLAQLSMLKLAQRMTRAFAASVCSSAVGEWRKLEQDNHIAVTALVATSSVMTRKSFPEAGEPPGIVLCASTAVWMPVAQRRLFDFLRDESCRSQWDVLGDDGPLYRMTHLAMGHDAANAVVLLRSAAAQQLIIQETSIDASGDAMVVYAPVDVGSMHQVMNNGGDPAHVGLLPCGFAILPDAMGGAGGLNSGSLLTVGFQISHRTASVTPEAVEMINGLVSHTLQKIQIALNILTN